MLSFVFIFYNKGPLNKWWYNNVFIVWLFRWLLKFYFGSNLENTKQKFTGRPFHTLGRAKVGVVLTKHRGYTDVKSCYISQCLSVAACFPVACVAGCSWAIWRWAFLCPGRFPPSSQRGTTCPLRAPPPTTTASLWSLPLLPASQPAHADE